ncbi:MAG: hypothetical protein PWQ96_151 [Clostridia bacterium]|jgi:HEPN domain-containing protein|nr:hypothetical protein [Clostridia bacterium]
MSFQEQVKEWLAISEEDLQVAELCYNGGKFLHCAYMCQQAVEKTLKALINTGGITPPPIHNLPDLAIEGEVWDTMNSEQHMFLRALTTYAIEARYPERKRKLYEQCTRDEAEKLLSNSKGMVEWIRSIVEDRLSQGK